ncbi:ABC transporter substrate-binding protein [Nocardioides acrostichi]|uniref:ABC transporter substrate-binding protein n=1 Tax=Nocardioides acrostichi TaxID=2784339 RepID=A0A930UXV5_9ACTN|nr:ABC transporter substrate-binding protein [Nocardioides acrostichi]MBF4162883.1 ABC transporter substrate-binding protein [Nocardioides acrostichi]
MRIVSLLPSTTEICFALGVGDDVVGVTFECDFPPEARSRRVVSSTTMPHGLTPAEIDAFVVAATRAGEDLYRLDAGALAELDADLVLTQDLCAVCAIDVADVDAALAHLGCTATVHSFDPHTLTEIAESIRAIGRAVDRPEAADALAATLDLPAPPPYPRPRVVVLEWTDPPYAPGHWIPEMVAAAGGECVLGAAGQKSERVTWDDVRDARPDFIVVAPCGYDRNGAQEQADALVAANVLPPGVPVHAVDANAHWARPGPRVIEGVADLASALQTLVEPGEALAESRVETP